MLESQPKITFVRVLGTGGFGAVYLVDVETSSRLRRRAALKILNERMGQNRDAVARQRDEAHLLAQLNHDHIVKVFDLLEFEGRPAVLMEHINGVDTQRLLRDEPFPPRAAAEAIAGAAAALEAATTHISPITDRPLNVIHRDIKPANLLLSRHGSIKVLDFGIARADCEREGKTESVMYGTIRFIPPEQWLHHHVSPAGDIYALALTFVELLTGQPIERPPLMQDAYQHHVQRMLATLRQHGPWHQSAASLLEGMLAYAPQNRPNAATACHALLELAKTAPGESLHQFAQRVVPDVLKQQRAHFANHPLPSQIKPRSNQPITAPKTSKRPIKWLGVGLGTLSVAVTLATLNSFQATGPHSVSISVHKQQHRRPKTQVSEPAEHSAEVQDVHENTTEFSPVAPQPTVATRSTEDESPNADLTHPYQGPENTVQPSDTTNTPSDMANSVLTREVTLLGPSLDAAIFVDGVQVTISGHTTVSLTYGTHLVRIVAVPFGEQTREIEVGASTVETYQWKHGTSSIVGVQ